MAVGIWSLPPELVLSITEYLASAADVLRLGRTCRWFHACTDNDLLWKSLCSRWQYWNDRPQSQSLTWKERYSLRRDIDKDIDEILHNLIYNPDDAPYFTKFPPSNNLVLKFSGIEAKDRLLHHLRAPGNAEDRLAREYWARSLLVSIGRRTALHEFKRAMEDPNPSLERLMTSVDMFFRVDARTDFGSVALKLDAIARFFKQEHVQYQNYSTRKLALSLAQYFVKEELFAYEGLTTPLYFPAYCNFISIVLDYPPSGGMPFTYCIIYCLVARRLGLDANCLNVPSKMYVEVQCHGDIDLDGRIRSLKSQRQKMYLDLWRKDNQEVPRSTIEQLLFMFEVELPKHDKYFQPASAWQLIHRFANNIRIDLDNREVPGHIDANHHPALPDMTGMHYSFFWIAGFLPSFLEQWKSIYYSSLEFFADQLRYWLFDMALLETEYMPLFRDKDFYRALQQGLSAISTELHSVPTIKRRSRYTREEIKYDIGTYFRHRRLGYEGFIIGWIRIPADIDGQSSVEVDDDAEETQTFYDVMAHIKDPDRFENKSVAQDNIVPWESDREPVGPLMSIAGRWYLRWDSDKRRFVHNGFAAYPDD